MDHSEAVELQAAERYVLGELTETQREEYEEHCFGCTTCAADLKAAAAFVDSSRQVFREEVPEVREVRVPAPARGGWFAWLRPAIALPVMAALLLVVGYQNFVTIPGLKGGTAQVAPAKVVRSFSLLNVGTRGGDGLTIDVKPQEDFGLDVDIPASDAAAGYVCQVENAAGQVAFRVPVSAAAAKNTVHVNVKGGTLSPGKYRFVVFRANADGSTNGSEVAHFNFIVEHSASS